MYKKIVFIIGFSFVVAICTTLFLSSNVWYTNIQSFFAEVLDRPEYYGTPDTPRLAYNKALALAKKGQFDTAGSLLKNINTLENNEFIRNVLELQGDIAYMQKTNTGEIIAYYDRSLQIQNHPRVLYKKSLLLDSKPSQQSNHNESKAIQEITDNIDRIQEIQKNRAQYLNTQINNPGQKKEELERIKRALHDTDFTPIKDW